jgi:prolyl 4-hydroxylase
MAAMAAMARRRRVLLPILLLAVAFTSSASAAGSAPQSTQSITTTSPPEDGDGDAFTFALDELSANATAGGRWLETLAWSPRAFLMHRFLSEAEADHLVALAKPFMRTSQIVDSKTGKLFASQARTSKGFFLKRAQDAVVERVERRIAAWTKLPPENGETLHILEYDKTEQYRPHFDTFTDSVNVKRGGQRVATVLVYLSDVTRGGETIFPDAEPRSLEPAAAARLDAMTDAGELSKCAADAPLAVKPRKGDALLFYSVTPSGEPDEASLHASCPVEEGTKWSATRWIREDKFV